MEKYVFILQEDVCAKNGKDPSGTRLLEKMNEYGKVIRFDDCINEVKAEYQASIDNLVKQVESLSERNLTNDELRLVNAYRMCKQDSDQQFLAKIAVLQNDKAKIKKSFDNFTKSLRDVIEREANAEPEIDTDENKE